MKSTLMAADPICDIGDGSMASERSDVLSWAMGYPFPAPPRSFVQIGHRTLDPDEVEIDRAERLPLLAYGSNASPAMLARKLVLSPEPALVVPAWLDDFDTVYSAHISPYGAVPATLRHSPGTAVRVSVAYLTAEQLSLLSTTEPNYELSTLAAVECHTEEGVTETELSAYLSRHGCLLADGAEIALAAIEARERRFAALSEPQMLERVRSRVCPEEDIETFILSSVTDPDLAHARSARLERRQPGPP
jgi:hypothetical protein